MHTIKHEMTNMRVNVSWTESPTGVPAIAIYFPNNGGTFNHRELDELLTLLHEVEGEVWGPKEGK